MRRMFLTFFAAILAASASAQECSQLLNHGIYDIRSSASDLTTASSFSNWFCDNNFSSSQKADEFGASLGFPFKGVPVKLGFNSSGQNWSEWYSSFCANVKQDQSLQSKVREHIQTVNPQIIQAFDSCFQADGLHLWLEKTDNPRTFKFVARFNPPDPEGSPRTRITTFDTGDNVSCTERPTDISKNEWRTRCTRNDDKSVTIIVVTNLFIPLTRSCARNPIVVS